MYRSGRTEVVRTMYRNGHVPNWSYPVADSESRIDNINRYLEQALSYTRRFLWPPKCATMHFRPRFRPTPSAGTFDAPSGTLISKSFPIPKPLGAFVDSIVWPPLLEPNPVLATAANNRRPLTCIVKRYLATVTSLQVNCNRYYGLFNGCRCVSVRKGDGHGPRTMPCGWQRVRQLCFHLRLLLHLSTLLRWVKALGLQCIIYHLLPVYAMTETCCMYDKGARAGCQSWMAAVKSVDLNIALQVSDISQRDGHFLTSELFTMTYVAVVFDHYTLCCQKRDLYTFAYNFDRYWRIFAIFPLLNSSRNSQQSHCCNVHHT